MYTPTQLQADRQDLNQSWYSSSPPDHHYFTVQIQAGDVHSTPDGWPNEAHVEFSNRQRLLVGWGSVDPQMSRYNFTGDEGAIFPQGELGAERSVSATSSGNIANGCSFDPSVTELAKMNSSWAVVKGLEGPYSTAESLDPALNLTANLALCGISPLLNSTLLNSTALQDPTCSHHSDDSSSSSSPLFRCTTTDSSVNGRWKVDDCSQRYPVACRIDSRPYDWRITDDATIYSLANEVCPSGSTFSAPRTGLENMYLWRRLLDRRDAANRAGGVVWIDFNSIDMEGCWVTGGPNATCPYFDDTGE
ncbi:hypothetical protein GP486_005597, partial [Trichoglossum hirsutum]